MFHFTKARIAPLSMSIRASVLLAASALLFCVFTTVNVNAQTTAFTYQGHLTESINSPSGPYDFQFAVFDLAGMQQGPLQTISGVSVANGVFTVSLDFGSAPFAVGEDRYLEIRVKKLPAVTYTVLSPRQRITSVPYAIRSISAASADIASTVPDGAITSSKLASNLTLGGTTTGTFSGDGSALTNLPASPVADGSITNAKLASSLIVPIANGGTGSATKNFVDLTTNQTGILGNKTFTDTVSANTVNVTTQYNIGGSRVLSNAGLGNLFAGAGAGAVNTGFLNSFFGPNAGLSNTNALSNSFFGSFAGEFTTTGGGNTFIGSSAGNKNITSGNNSFVGAFAGQNTTGASNSFVGALAGQNNTTGVNNIALGTNAGSNLSTGSNNIVIGNNGVAAESNIIRIGSSQTDTYLTGIIHGNGSALTNLPAGTIADGSITTAKLADGSVTSPKLASGLTLAGTTTGTFSGSLTGNASTATSANTATTAGNVTGIVAIANGGTGSTTQNFVDLSTTQTVAGAKTFSSSVAAPTFNATTQYNIGGNPVLSLGAPFSSNLFVGLSAGNTAPANTGVSNSFVGNAAGGNNTTGSGNSFFGAGAGQANTSGEYNSFVGWSAGFNNVGGENNSFFGREAGNANTTGLSNSFVGSQAGFANTTGSNNIALGKNAGANLTTGSNNIAIGNTGVAGESNIIRIGSGQTDTYLTGTVRTPTLALGSLSADPTGINGLMYYNTTLLKFRCFENSAWANCISGAPMARTQEAEAAVIETLRQEVKVQQVMIDELRKIVCSANPTAGVCKEQK